MSDHRVSALGWGAVLTTRKTVPDDLRYVGVRAHYWLPADPDAKPENVVAGKIERVIEDAFQRVDYCLQQLQETFDYLIAPECVAAEIDQGMKILPDSQ